MLNREIVKINSFPYYSAMFHLMEINIVSENINIDILKDKSNLLNPNISRESSAYSDLLSVSYINRMEAQNLNPSWADQTEF